MRALPAPVVRLPLGRRAVGQQYYLLDLQAGSLFKAIASAVRVASERMGAEINETLTTPERVPATIPT